MTIRHNNACCWCAICCAGSVWALKVAFVALCGWLVCFSGGPHERIVSYDSFAQVLSTYINETNGTKIPDTTLRKLFATLEGSDRASSPLQAEGYISPYSTPTFQTSVNGITPSNMTKTSDSTPDSNGNAPSSANKAVEAPSLSLPSPVTPRATLVTMPNILYTLGFLITAGAMLFFITVGWQAFGGVGLAVVSILYNAAFVYFSILMHNKGVPIPASIFQTLSVLTVPLTVYGLTNLRVRRTMTDEIFKWVSYEPVRSYIPIEACTAGSALLSMVVAPNAFLLLPGCVAVGYLTRDLLLPHGWAMYFAQVPLLVVARHVVVLSREGKLPTLDSMNFHVPFIPEAYYWPIVSSAIGMVVASIVIEKSGKERATGALAIARALMGITLVVWTPQQVLEGHPVLAALFQIAMCLFCADFVQSLRRILAIPRKVALSGVVFALWGYLCIGYVQFRPREEMSRWESILCPFTPQQITITSFFLLALSAARQCRNRFTAGVALPSALFFVGLHVLYPSRGLWAFAAVMFMHGILPMFLNYRAYYAVSFVSLLALCGCITIFSSEPHSLSNLFVLLGVAWAHLVGFSKNGGDHKKTVFWAGSTIVVAALIFFGETPPLWLIIPPMVYRVIRTRLPRIVGLPFGVAMYVVFYVYTQDGTRPLEISTPSRLLYELSYDNLTYVALSSYIWGCFYMTYNLDAVMRVIIPLFPPHFGDFFVFAVTTFLRWFTPSYLVRLGYVWYAILAVGSMRWPDAAMWWPTTTRLPATRHVFQNLGCAVCLIASGFLFHPLSTRNAMGESILVVSWDHIPEFVVMTLGVQQLFFVTQFLTTTSDPRVVLGVACAGNIIAAFVKIQLVQMALLPFVLNPVLLAVSRSGSLLSTESFISLLAHAPCVHTLQMFLHSVDPLPFLTEPSVLWTASSYTNMRVLYYATSGFGTALVLAYPPSRVYAATRAVVALVWLILDRTDSTLFMVFIVTLITAWQHHNSSLLKPLLGGWLWCSPFSMIGIIYSGMVLDAHRNLQSATFECFSVAYTFLSVVFILNFIEVNHATSAMYVHMFFLFTAFAYLSCLHTFSNGLIAFVISVTWLGMISVVIQRMQHLNKHSYRLTDRGTVRARPFYLVAISRVMVVLATHSLLLLNKALSNEKLFYLGFIVLVQVLWDLLKRLESRALFLGIALSIITLPTGIATQSKMVIFTSVAGILFFLNAMAVVVFSRSMAFPFILTSSGVALVYCAMQWEQWMEPGAEVSKHTQLERLTESLSGFEVILHAHLVQDLKSMLRMVPSIIPR